MAQLVSEYGTPANAAVTTSGTTSAATRTITCPVGARIRLRTIVIYASVGSNATLTVSVGGVVVLDYGTNALTTAPTIFSPNIVGAVGQTVLINIGAGSAGTTSTTHSAEIF
jgi:hypothetical protein